MDNNGSNQMLIGYDELTGGGSRNPHWGKTNRIVHYRHQGKANPNIFIMDVDGGNLKRLTFEDKTDREPKLSPDGRQIVYSSQDRAQGGDARPSIFIVDDSGTTKMLARPGVNADWSTDGKTIVYTQSSSTNGRLWLIAPDGSSKRQLTFKNQF